jgi:soluble lytic murein transglycosylase
LARESNRKTGTNAKIAAFLIAIMVIGGIVGAFTFLYPYKYIDLIREYSRKYGLEPDLVCAVIHTESRFRPGITSPKGARGLMQLTKGTADWGAEEVGIPGYAYENVTEPVVNIELGCWYLSVLLKQFTETETALAAYNAGSGNVERWLDDASLSADGVKLDDIPFGETRRYVGRVDGARAVYRILLRIGGFFRE